MTNYKITSYWIHRIMRLPRRILVFFFFFFLRSTIIPRDRDTRAITAALSKLVCCTSPLSSPRYIHFPLSLPFILLDIYLDILRIIPDGFKILKVFPYPWYMYSINPLHSDVIYTIFLNRKRYALRILWYFFFFFKEEGQLCVSLVLSAWKTIPSANQVPLLLFI